MSNWFVKHLLALKIGIKNTDPLKLPDWTAGIEPADKSSKMAKMQQPLSLTNLDVGKRFITVRRTRRP